MINTCPNCKTQIGAPDWKARMTYLWANQWGNKVRIFCDVCGQWSDVTYTDKLLGEIVEVRKEPHTFFEKSSPGNQTDEFYADMDDYFSQEPTP